MTWRARSVVAVVVASLLSGCSTPADQSSGPVGSAPTSSAGLPGASTATVPSPTRIANPTPSPVAVVIPGLSDLDAPWTGIRWRNLAADDPLAEIRTVTRWRGGYIGRGDPTAPDGSKPAPGDSAVHTRLWISLDGRTWALLSAARRGTSGIVVGMAPTTDGIVALTVQPGPTVRDDETTDLSWGVAGPVQAWTSSDGRTWTAHPGPDIELASGTTLTVHDIDWLHASTASLLFVARGSRPPFVSTNGVEWKRQATSGLPAAYPLPSVRAAGSGFVAVRDHVIASSSDGRTWTTTTLPPTCSADQGIVVGRDGVIVAGIPESNGNGVAKWTWCASGDLKTWSELPGLPPLGKMHEDGSQECRDACPNGSLVGDGQRMLAYRGWADQAGWTSFDGRHWQPLTFGGRPELSAGWLDDGCTHSLVLLPMGVRCTAEGGAAWFGEPQS